MSADKLAYLTRTLLRHQIEARASARAGRDQAIAQGASTGFGGNVLFQIGREYDEAAKNATDAMVKHTYELMGDNSSAVCKTLERALYGLRAGLSNDLANFLRSPQCSWAPKVAADAIGRSFLEAMGGRIGAAIDDFRFGISGGRKLSKDPVVSVISSISNSPGATLQSGIGNVQRAVTASGSNALRLAVSEFLNSQEVQNLSPDNKQSVTDVAEVLTAELDKPSPDPSKLQRWGKRLLDIAERLGTAVAASAINHALFG
jgi:hypothetical protein